MKKILNLIMICVSVFCSSLQADAKEITQEIITLLESGSSKEYFGEDVSQLFHSLQAAQLAFDAHCDEEIIIAALLHDIGHIQGAHTAIQMGDYGSMNHEIIGAQFLKQKGFSPKVVAIVRGHVNAKRYLCYKNPEYYNGLSLASKETLKFQGGPMIEQEAQEFEQDLFFKEILLVRSFDEQAKDSRAKVKSVEEYVVLIEKHLAKNLRNN